MCAVCVYMFSKENIKISKHIDDEFCVNQNIPQDLLLLAGIATFLIVNTKESFSLLL